jgi:hypothetical protein
MAHHCDNALMVTGPGEERQRLAGLFTDGRTGKGRQ